MAPGVVGRRQTLPLGLPRMRGTRAGSQRTEVCKRTVFAIAQFTLKPLPRSRKILAFSLVLTAEPRSGALDAFGFATGLGFVDARREVHHRLRNRFGATNRVLISLPEGLAWGHRREQDYGEK